MLALCSLLTSFLRIVFGTFTVTDYASIKELYDSTNGQEWNFRNESAGAIWDFTIGYVDACELNWQGLHCSSSGLSGINLVNYNLNGNLSDWQLLKNLSLLEELDLSQNSLRGSLPVSLSNLTMLKNFNVSINMFTSTVPTEISKLTKLVSFSVWMNSLEGQIFEILPSFVNLKTVDIEGNRFRGKLPKAISSLQKLEYFFAGSNLFSG